MFPAQVTTPDGRLHTSCRLHHDGRTLVVWDWDYQARQARVVIEVPALGDLGALPWQLEVDGGTLDVASQNGCGCGHPLRKHTTPPPAREYTGP